MEARKISTQIVAEVVDLVLALVSNRYLRQQGQQGGPESSSSTTTKDKISMVAISDSTFGGGCGRNKSLK